MHKTKYVSEVFQLILSIYNTKPDYGLRANNNIIFTNISLAQMIIYMSY